MDLPESERTWLRKGVQHTYVVRDPKTKVTGDMTDASAEERNSNTNRAKSVARPKESFM